MSIDVRCRADGDGWACAVDVDAASGGPTRHTVSVSAAEFGRFDRDATDPERLVRASFDFLLERESATSILRSFELSVIERYFPDYPREIRSRLHD
jgi:hypothetical protein